MTYEEFKQAKNRIRERQLPFVYQQMGIEFDMKNVFISYGKDTISKYAALKKLEGLLYRWRSAQEAINALKEEENELVKQVEL